MTPSQLARMLGVTVNTVRNWAGIYKTYLTPSATPRKGKARHFSKHDQRVLYTVATFRNSNMTEDEIKKRLDELQENNWDDLPQLPPEFAEIPAGELQIISTEERARELAQVQVLQGEMARLQTALERAETRVEQLEHEISELRQSENITREALHKKELDLQKAVGDTEALKRELSQYALGRDKPLNVGVLVLAALVAGVLITLLVLVVMRLVM